MIAKSELRTLIRQKRAALSPEIKRHAAHKIIHWFNSSGLTRRPIAGYWPTRHELDVRPLLDHLHRQGWECSLPVVVREDASLIFRLWSPGQPLVPDGKGLLGPEPTASVCTPEMVLAPLIAFDDQGFRLGQGGGYYDRTLAALRPSVYVIGVAFSLQRTPRVPRQDHDLPLDALLTEQEWRVFNP